MQIKKAIVAAGGWSTRFLPAVKTYPKQLVPILDKPIIQIVLEELIGAGVDQICIVHRPGELMFRKHFARDKELEKYLKETGKEKCLESLYFIWNKLKKLDFAPQYRHLPYGNASPVLAAKNFVGSQPFIVAFGDDLILEEEPGQYLSQMIETFNRYKPTIVLGGQPVAKKEISAYGCIKYKQKSKIPNQAEAIIEKPSLGEAPSNVAVVGRYLLAPEALSILEKQKTSRGNELWLADTCNIVAQESLAIAEPIRPPAKWLTTGDPLNWLKTSITFGMKNERIKQQLKGLLS